MTAWENVDWHEPIEIDRPSHGPYDIYVVAEIDGLKAENADLGERVKRLQEENAKLHACLDRYRRMGITREEDWEWLTS